MQSTGANPQEDAGPPPSTNPQEYYKHLSLFWTDLLYLSLIHISEPTRPY